MMMMTATGKDGSTRCVTKSPARTPPREPNAMDQPYVASSKNVKPQRRLHRQIYLHTAVDTLTNTSPSKQRHVVPLSLNRTPPLCHFLPGALSFLPFPVFEYRAPSLSLSLSLSLHNPPSIFPVCSHPTFSQKYLTLDNPNQTLPSPTSFYYIYTPLQYFSPRIPVQDLTAMASPIVESPKHRLLQAASDGKLKLLEELGEELDFGEGLAKTFVQVKDAGGRTALHFAAAEGKTQLCKYLVQDLGLDANLKDRKGDTPLNYATLGQQNLTVAWLAANGANPNLGNVKGFCALHYAAENGLKDLIRLLISKGAEIEAESHAGTPLQCAAAHGRKEAVKMLLDRKANPNTVGHRIFTPLVSSILAGSIECVCMLLKEGLMPLEIAALHSNHAAVMVLFPVTSRIPTIPDWSLVGIMKHVHSDEGRRQRGLKKMETFLLAKSRGEKAFKRKDYTDALYIGTHRQLMYLHVMQLYFPIEACAGPA